MPKQSIKVARRAQEDSPQRRAEDVAPYKCAASIAEAIGTQEPNVPYGTSLRSVAVALRARLSEMTGQSCRERRPRRSATYICGVYDSHALRDAEPNVPYEVSYAKSAFAAGNDVLVGVGIGNHSVFGEIFVRAREHIVVARL